MTTSLPRFFAFLFFCCAVLFVVAAGQPQVYGAPATTASDATGPWIFVYPGSINHSHTTPPQSSFETLTIENTGPDFVFYTLHMASMDCNVPDAPAWLLTSSGSGSLPPMAFETISIELNSAGLLDGIYTALICVQDITHPQNPYHQVFVELSVAGATPPTLTPEPPTATPEIPTATPEIPTATPEIPTATPELPSPTPKIPPITPEPPTATPEIAVTPTTPPTTYWVYLPLARRR